MPIDAPGSVCGGQGADSAQIGRETDVALAMALIQTPFHTAWANNRHLTPGYVATAYTRSDAPFQHKSVGITYLGAARNADA